MKPNQRNRTLQLAVAVLALAAHAEDKPAMTAAKPADAGTVNSLFNTQLPDAIGKGKFSLNSRLRYEYADQAAAGAGPDPKESNAFTIRTRFGFTTGKLYGFQGMLEGENITVIGPKSNFNAAGSNGQPGKTIVADPATTELNQAWLSYANTNWMSSVKGGRQRIVLDNHRFVGDVGWRQNQQTFDAVAFETKPFKDFTLDYDYIWDVHRVFGDVPGLPAGNTDFDSSSHIVNASYSGWKYGKFVGYTYLLDLKNAAGAANSCATYGGYFAGSAPVTDKVKVDYRAELAWQTDYADSPASYQAVFYSFEAGLNVKPFVFGAGYEVMGTDTDSKTGVSQGFRTPLATLHAFDGWADVFLNTPAKGIRDLYGFAQVSLMSDMPLRFVYHKFDAASGGADFGQEFDVLLTKKLGKYWSAAAKYAHYSAESLPYADVDKVWLQVEFNF